MGEVWKARDSRLDRIVALKFSTTEFSQHFEREARVISSLNHPHICQLYNVGPDYLVMEFVDGKPLTGPMSVEKALHYSGQVLDALHAAHSRGIVHRDLKPANILVNKSGAKLLDFGIARQLTPGLDAHTRTATIKGEVIGTLEFMSPEQLQGEPVDARSDIFSFGCVLYEWLSGRKPFTGHSSATVMSAILEREAPALDIPPSLARIVRTCLAKDRDQRFQSALDLKRSLEWSTESQPAPASTRRRTTLFAIIAGTLTVALASALGFVLLRPPSPPPVEYIATRLTYDDGLTTDPAISRDGKLIAFASDRSGADHLDVYVQQAGGGPAVRLTHTAGDDHEPTFSPDGSTIVFRSERDGGGLYTMPALGGDARLLVQAGHDPRFSPDGRYIAYTTEKSGTDTVAVAGRCYVIPAIGGEPRLVTPEFRGATWPIWIASRTLLFLGVTVETTDLRWWTTDVENPRPVVSTLMPITARGAALGSEGKQLVFVSGAGNDVGGVWTVPFDPSTATATGAPRRLMVGLGDSVRVSVTDDGTFAAARTHPAPNVWSVPLDGKTAPTQLTFDAAPKSLPDISPDGQRLIYVSNRSGNDDVFMRDLATGRETAIAATALREAHPLFTAGGTRVAFAQYADTPPTFKVFSFPTSGGAARLLADISSGRFDQVSEDGRFVVRHAGPEPALTVYDLTTKAEEIIVRAPSRSIYQPRISRDGEWITFLVKADETDSRIYGARFRGTKPIPSSEWVPLSKGNAGDDKPRLSADRRRLYFTSKADGHRCIWIQELDPATLQPIGAPVAFQHFHSARRSLDRVLSNLQEIGIGGNRLIFNMAETTGNLWLLRPQTALR